ASTASCVVLFFFSSRRRHTRFSRDWSSDVCSSDLEHRAPYGTGDVSPRQGSWLPRPLGRKVLYAYTQETRSVPLLRSGAHARREIGRASCRGRAETRGGAGASEKTKQSRAGPRPAD